MAPATNGAAKKVRRVIADILSCIARLLSYHVGTGDPRRDAGSRYTSKVPRQKGSNALVSLRHGTLDDAPR